ncbi:IclR family transcriptional regulator C-terminal domain-containing protein [Notoacmeibacter sp. MSK16QG-6]|uniref:IclR family transcriptional regulator domain-containing protein n=1 Tax=Notoacmeibacter sp. MSK16QG-6 TaxID=2957982 RepID=UPI00209E6E7C|nr:IclR family transcriptional regulator C-terminal domain-containing protein [Notoacmeibacter sp. MSK16QG-6]MCP1199585.1 helix-turn-helix domain-containing protein [Notoacmeibacter sp. MSK16QG-6]
MNEINTPVRGTALLTKALDIVELISDTDNRLKFKDIAERTGHSKSTLYRILSALSARGMIDIDQRDQSYVLGPKFTEMAGSINSSSDLIAVSAAPLKGLADQHGENVNLSILLGTAQVTISRWQGRLSQPFHSPIGERKPLYATGLGKCLLAFLPEQEREALMSRMRLTAYTPYTITDLESLRADIEMTRARGFAIDDNEIIEGVVCVSTPILSAENRPLASVSITVPAHRMNEERRLELASVLQMTSRHIGQLLLPQNNGQATYPSPPAGGRLEVIDTRAFSSKALGYSSVWGGLVWQDGPGGSIHLERDGESARLVETSQIDASTLMPSGHILFVSDGALMRLEPSGNAAYEERTGADFSDVNDIAALSEEQLLVLREGNLVSIDRSSWNSTELMSGLCGRAGISISDDGDAVLAARMQDNCLVRLALSKNGTALTEITEISRSGNGRISGLSFDRSGKIWVAYHQSWSLCMYDADGEKAQHVPVPMPNLQGLAPGERVNSVVAGSDRYTMSQSLIQAAPSSGGLVKITL